jgi:hypothetical protein
MELKSKPIQDTFRHKEFSGAQSKMRAKTAELFLPYQIAVPMNKINQM